MTHIAILAPVLWVRVCRADHAQYVHRGIERHFGADKALRALLEYPPDTLGIDEFPVCQNGNGPGMSRT